MSGHILGASKKPIWVTSWLWFKGTVSYVIHNFFKSRGENQDPKPLLPRHWDAGLYYRMSMLSPTVGGHKVLGKGTWWTAGITVLCCISPNGLGFVVQASRTLFAQLETCCSQHDSSIYNVLLPDTFGSFGEVPLRSHTRAWPCCQNHTIPSALWPPSEVNPQRRINFA